MRDELGDLLLQVTFHAQIAADEGRWDIDDVAEGLVAKLVHRHPHVFGDVEVADADEVLRNWEKLKAEETGGRKGVEEDIPATLPALARAAKVQRRAAGWGFAWRTVEQALASFARGSTSLGTRAGTRPRRGGARRGAARGGRRGAPLGLDAESALRRATTPFAERAERAIAWRRARPGSRRAVR